MPKNLTMIDLFAGAGGLSEGFIRAGFTPIAHVEMDTAACNTLRTRAAYHWLKSENRLDVYNSYLNRSISRDELYSVIPGAIMRSVIEASIGPDTNPAIFERIREHHKRKTVDLVVGGPPCQAYSLMGRSADPNRMQGDHRNYLFVYYIEFLKEFRPKYFVFENVTGLLSAKDQDGNKYLDLIETAFNEAGYQISPLRILDASEHGVPQKRKRVIIIGRRGTSKPKYPKLRKTSPYETIIELFSDLPSLSANDQSSDYLPKCNEQHQQNLVKLGLRQHCRQLPLTQHVSRPHIERDLKIYKKAALDWINEGRRLRYNELPKELQTHKNTHSFSDRFKVVAGNATASHTVVAHIAKDGHYYIHPDPEQNRSISVREAARLQTFPDDYYFEGIKEGSYRTAAFKQIGNAVPVLLAQRIGEALAAQWADL